MNCWNDNDKLYLYNQCRRFAASNCPEELRSSIDDVAHNAFLKATKELPGILPEPGKTKTGCLEALACFRVIDEYKHLATRKVRMVTRAIPLCPTDRPEEDNSQTPDSLVLGDSCSSLDAMFAHLDRNASPAWLREFRKVYRGLWGRDLLLVHALLRATDPSARRLPNHSRIRQELHMSWREFYFRLHRLRRRFARAMLLLQQHQQ